MKVTRDTADQLIVENNPIWLAIFVSTFALTFIAAGLFIIQEATLFGAAFVLGGVVIGVVFNIAFVRRTQLILDAPRNLVELRHKSLLGYKRRTWDLIHLDRAIIQTSRSSDTTTYRSALVISDGMDAGTHPITIVYSSGSGADRAAAAINRWRAAALDSSLPRT